MLKLIRILFWSIFLVSCAFIIPKKHHIDIEPELQGMLNVIKRVTKGKLGTNTKYLGWFKEDTDEDDGYKTVGTCSVVVDWKNITIERQIDIHRNSWYAYDVRSKFLLLAHEIRHCECDDDHIKTDLSDGCPSHFMGEVMPESQCMDTHWLRYLKQVKKGCDE